MPKVYQKPQVQKENKVLKYALSALFMALVLAFTLYIILKDSSLEEIANSLLSADWRYVLMGFGFMLVHQLCVSEVLRILLNKLVRVRMPWLAYFNTSFIGFYFNNITPSATGGQPMEIYYLYRCRADVAGTSLVFMAMTFFNNLALVCFTSYALLAHGDLVFSSLGNIKFLLYFGYVFNGGLMLLMLGLMLFPSGLKSLSEGIVHRLEVWKILRPRPERQVKIDSFFSQYRQSSANLFKDPLLLLRLLLLHFIQVGALLSVPYAAILALGGEKDLFLSSFALSSTLQLASAGFPTPGAVGLTESGFLRLFATAIPKEKVVPAMLLSRFINLYAFLILSAIITVLAFLTAPLLGRHTKSLDP